MGWLFTYGQTRSELIRERTDGSTWSRDDGVQMTDKRLARCFKGAAWKGTLWIVWERTATHPDGRIEPKRWIECDLLAYQRDYGWGYKDMQESMGPVEANCPLKYLEMVPPIEGDLNQDGAAKWSHDWRTRVRAHHERRRARLADRRARSVGETPLVRIKLD